MTGRRRKTPKKRTSRGSQSLGGRAAEAVKASGPSTRPSPPRREVTATRPLPPRSRIVAKLAMDDGTSLAPEQRYLLRIQREVARREAMLRNAVLLGALVAVALVSAAVAWLSGLV